jgi:hypothetical protein
MLERSTARKVPDQDKLSGEGNGDFKGRQGQNTVELEPFLAFPGRIVADIVPEAVAADARVAGRDCVVLYFRRQHRVSR